MNAQPNSLPSQQRLLDALDYDPRTGNLTWRARPDCPLSWNTRRSGKPAFTCRSKGYYIGRFDYVAYPAHRIIWKMIYNTEPPEIDHLNGVRGDNRIANLQASNRFMNMKNRKISRSNTSGFCGVSWAKGRNSWCAYIKTNKTQIHIGYFKDKDAAVAARKIKAREMGFSERHG